MPRSPRSEVSAHQFIDHGSGDAGLFGQVVLEDLRAARQIAGNRLIGRHRRKQLGLFLDHLREAFFDQAVEYLINLLPRNVRVSGQFQSP